MRGFLSSAIGASFSLARLAAALPATPVIEERATAPQVAISPENTVVGLLSGNVEKYAGIPFADAPTGNLRLRPPQRLSTNLGSAFDATAPAPACPQMLFSTEGNNFVTNLLGTLTQLPLFEAAFDVTEDCLSVSIMRPAGTQAGDNLPVLFWIFGGGFELGWSAQYDGGDLLEQAIAQNQSFIFVAVNYRVAGFGFLPGAEVLADGAANLGLLDQRMGLEWVADNIAAFGGDPTKVTIWGQSAGSISVFDQLALYDGDNTYNGQALFRGAIMNSGSIAPTLPVDSDKAQAVYDQVVEEAGCAQAVGSNITSLDCLRALPYADFLAAVNTLPGVLSSSSLALSYLPRPDGTVLTASPDVLAAEGRYAAVPMIVGDQRDEGTLFALFTTSLTDNDALTEYLATQCFTNATDEQIAALLDTYPTDIKAGSPFGTGILNEIYPGFKRNAAVLGDLVFTLSRRVFLEVADLVNSAVPSWSYMATYNEDFPIMGTFHASDVIQVFFGIKDNYAAQSIRTYYFNFLYNLDPNDNTGSTAIEYPNWPAWKDTGSGNEILEFKADTSQVITDDFRSTSYDVIKANVAGFYL